MVFSDATRINPDRIIVEIETGAELSNRSWCRHLIWLDHVGLGFPSGWRGLMWADDWPCSCLPLWRSPQSGEAACGAAAAVTGAGGCWPWWVHPAPPPAPRPSRVSSGGPSVRTWSGDAGAAGRRRGWCIPDRKTEGRVVRTGSERGSSLRHFPQGPGNLVTWHPLRPCGGWRSACKTSPGCCSLCQSACFLCQQRRVPVCPPGGLLGCSGLWGRGSLRENNEMWAHQHKDAHHLSSPLT